MPEPPENPHIRWKPEYLGQPYVLNHNIPNYMPSNEADLMDWLHNYVNVALTYVETFPDVLGSEAPFPRAQVASLRSHIVTMRLATREADDLSRSWRAFTRIALFASEHRLAEPLTSPVITTSLTTPYSESLVGIVGIIDAQVRALRVHENFNQTIAEHLGIIPRAPAGPPNPSTLSPGGRTRNDGGEVLVTFKSAASIRGVFGVEIRVDRGDGTLHFLTTTGGSRFIDAHVQPERPTAWVYYLNYVNERGIAIGVQSSVTVTVQAMRK